jgi:2-methylcitrate dehydratase PrpD
MSTPAATTTGPTQTQRFVEWAAALRYEDLPDDAIMHARRLLLDSVGIAIASTTRDFGQRFRDLPVAGRNGHGATAMGLEGRVPADRAALINGTLAHGLDFDDTYQAGFVHIGAIVIPAALAVAEEVGASMEELIVAVVIGYEFSSRIGEAAPGQFHKYGWHATPLCGTFAAALTAARLYGFTAEQMVTAVGISGSFTSGIQEFLRDGSDTKRLHTGWAASAGINAAHLARIGFEGPAGILEGHYGLYNTHLRPGDIVMPEKITEGLGERWNVTALSVKPFPCCHLMHAHIDASRRIIGQGVKVEDIVAVKAYAHQTTLHVLAEPLAEKQAPRTPYGAQFSLPYGVAIGLLDADRQIDLATFSPERITDPEVLRLAAMVECVLDPDSRLPKYLDGAVEVTLRDGTVIHERESINRGSPERPLENDEILDKFVGNAMLAGIEESRARAAGTEILKGSEFLPLVSELNMLALAD